jgi:sugar phosphate isomerase/epimerase
MSGSSSSSLPLELWSSTFRTEPLPALAAAAGAAGFSFVTTTPFRFMRDGGFGAGLRARIADAGVTVSVIDGLCSALPGTPPSIRSTGDFRDAHEAGFDDCVAIAHELGAPMINLVHIGGVPTPIDALADAFAGACTRAAAEGLRLGIEFVPGTGIPDLPTAAAVVRAAGAANGSIVLDTWHLARGGGGLADLDPATVAIVGGLQIADRSPEQDHEPYVPMRGRKIPGDGGLPLAEIVRRLRAAHPALPVGVEVLSDEVDALGPAEGARRLAAACRALGVGEAPLTG